MTQSERRAYLIRALLAEQSGYRDLAVPQSEAEQKRLLRALMNLREPQEIDAAFLRVQDAYLQEEAARKGITALDELTPVEPGLYLWQGDITTLCCDAIVNAANSGLTGCYIPCHSCIDNAIHTYAGVQLRLACARLLTAQGHPEPTGQAKITDGYNLPARHVLHTVGPIVTGGIPSEYQEEQLADCYRSCLALADAHGLESIAFCCISTGEFGFPQRRAAEIAVRTVTEYLDTNARTCINTVIFNVFKDDDLSIYRDILE